MDDKEIREAEDRGRRKQVVDSRLDGHDKKFSLLNGSLERMAKAHDRLADSVGVLGRKFEDLDTELRTKREVDQALRDVAEQSAKDSITRREYWMGVIIVAGAILSAAAQVGHL